MQLCNGLNNTDSIPGCLVLTIARIDRAPAMKVLETAVQGWYPSIKRWEGIVYASPHDL
jgi:hypothetical protein